MLPSVQEVKSCKMSPGFPSSKLASPASQLLKIAKIQLSGVIFFPSFGGKKGLKRPATRAHTASSAQEPQEVPLAPDKPQVMPHLRQINSCLPTYSWLQKLRGNCKKQLLLAGAIPFFCKCPLGEDFQLLLKSNPAPISNLG